MLLLLLDGADARRTERRQAEDRVEPLEGGEPGGHGLVAHLQVLAQGVDRERRADQLGQAQHQQLEMPEVLDALERRDLVAHQPGAVLARPATRLVPRCRRGTAPGNPPSVSSVRKSRRRTQPQLRRRERVQPQQVVAALQRVAAEAVEVEPSAAGDEDALSAPTAVVQTLEIVAPAPVLVELVEHPELRGRQLPTQDALAVPGNVPVEVPGPSTGQAQRERRLADLARPGDEDHLPAQIFAELRQEVASYDHGNSVREFHPWSKLLTGNFT